jgi:thiol-disulfide isomerase/thioredoxin
MNRRSLLAGAVGAAAATVGGTFAWWRLHRPAANPLWQLGFPSPAGGTVAMAPLRGRPLVLNFWATWCAPCIKELPQFERFHRDFGARGWQVVGLAIDSADAVREFLRRTPVSYPVGLAGMDGADLMIALGNPNGVLPFTVVFDAEGAAVQKRLGETAYEELLRWAQPR